MEKQAKSRKPLLVGVIVAVVVLAALLALLLTQCFGGQPDDTTPSTTVGGTTAPVDQVIDLYWNVDRGNYMDTANPDAGVTNRPIHEDGYYHVIFAHNGEQIDLPIVDRRLLTRIDAGDLMTLVFNENGVVIDATLIDNLPVQVIGSNWYVQSMGGTTVKINSAVSLDGMEEVFKYDKENTKIYDMSGLSEFIGAPTVIQRNDCVLVVASEDGKDILYVYILEREGIDRFKMAYCQHCKEEVQWQNWYYKDSAPIKDGHYYLETDVQQTRTAQVAEGAHVCLDLNGYTITGPMNQRAYTTFNAAAELAVMDNSEAQTGTIKSQGERMDQGTVLWARYGIISVYSGTYDASGATSKQDGTCICVEAGAMLNIYGGKIIGGTAVLREDKSQGQGGAICVRSTATMAATFNMYGGEIVGGKSENQGGNIIVSGTRAVFNMYGGTIRDGTSLKNEGGNMFLTGKAVFNMSGGTITGGTSVSSGNIFMYAGATLNMTGGTITGGKIRNAEGVYNDAAAARNIKLTNAYLNMYGGRINGYVSTQDTSAKDDYNTSVYVASSAKIIGAAAGHSNLLLGNNVIFKVGNLSKSAQIGISVPKPGPFSANAVPESVLANFTSDKARYEIGRDEEGKLTTLYDPEKSVKVHCICGDPNGTGTACAEEGHIQHKWYIWIDPSAAPFLDGFWYLDEDLDLTSASHTYYGDKAETEDKVDPFATATGIIGRVDYAEKDTDSVIKEGNVKVHVDLNGYTITGMSGHRVWRIENYDGNCLTVTDTSADKAGKVVAVSPDNNANPGMILWHQGGKVSTYIYAGTFDASRAAIRTWGDGGAFALFGKTTIYGGTIIGAKSETVANATIGNTGTLVLNGINDTIEIINTAQRLDAFQIRAGKKQEISGSIKFDRIYMAAGGRLVPVNLSADSSIGVDAAMYGRVTSGDSSAYLANFHAVDAGEAIKLNDDKTLALVGPNDEGLNDEGPHPSHCVCGGTDEHCALDEHTKIAGEWFPWDGKSAITESGNYFLTENVTTTQAWLGTAGEERVINLCLNGFNFTSSNRALAIRSNATVNIMNCGKTENTITGNGDHKYQGGVVYMTGNGSLSIYDRVNLVAGEDRLISQGGAINASSNDKIYLYGGSISGRKVIGKSADENAYFSGQGGTIYLGGAQLYIHDGVINGGETTLQGGAIFMGGNAELYMTGGVINAGKASEGAAVYAVGNIVDIGGTAKVTGGRIYTQSCEIRLSGTPTIDELYLKDDIRIGVAELEKDANINIELAAGKGFFTGIAKSADVAEAFHSINEAYEVKASNELTMALVDKGHTGDLVDPNPPEPEAPPRDPVTGDVTHCICGAQTEMGKHCDVCDHNVVVWKPWTITDAAPFLDGYWYLSDNLNLAKAPAQHKYYGDNAATAVAGDSFSTTTGIIGRKEYADSSDDSLVAADVNVYIDLDGRTLTTLSGHRGFRVDANGSYKRSLTITDTYGGGKIVASAINGSDQGMIILANAATVNIWGGTLNAKNVTVRVDRVGGAAIQSSAPVNMYGGKIIGGTALGNNGDATNAGLITLYNDASIVSGGGTSGTVRLGEGEYITLDSSWTVQSAELSVSVPNGFTGIFVKGQLTEEEAKIFTVTNLAADSQVVHKADGLYIEQSQGGGSEETDHPTHGVCGDKQCADHANITGTWTAWNGKTAITAGGNYYLTADITGGSQVWLGTENASTVINLCLNGHSINSNGRALAVRKSCTVNLMNCSTTESVLTGGGAGNYQGGVLYTQNDCTLSIYDNIKVVATEKSITSQGGAICTESGSKLNIHGAVINGRYVTKKAEGNAAYFNGLGGTIALGGGSEMTMTAGTINGGTAEGVGGTIYANKSKITISGGTVNGGTAATGGAIYLDGASELTVTGGKILGGTVTNKAACVYAVSDACKIKLSGTPEITEILLEKALRIDITSLSKDAKIGISAPAGAFTNVAESADVAEAFESKLAGYKVMATTANTMALVTEDTTGPVEDPDAPAPEDPDDGGDTTETRTHCYCGKTTTAGTQCSSCKSYVITWQPWSTANALPTSGNYYLTTNVNVAAQVTLDGGASLALNLNGHTVNQTTNYTRLFQVLNGTLTIVDTVGTGKLVPVANMYEVWPNEHWGGIVTLENANAKLNIYGGTLDASASVANYGSAIRLTNGTVNMYGGKIVGGETKASGGTVSIGNGSFNMFGGEINGGNNTSTNTSHGGGTIRMSGGTFNLVGGKIAGGSASVCGGALYMSNGEFNMAAGSIEGGSSKNGGAIAIKGGTFNLLGGTIKNGTASAGGGNLFMNGGSFIMTGGTITGGITTGSHGGNIRAFANSTLTVTGGIISDGVVNATGDNNGGNIAIVDQDAANAVVTTVTIGGNAKVTGGSANRGGSIFVHTGILKIEGNAVIEAGTATGIAATGDSGTGGYAPCILVNSSADKNVVITGTPKIAEINVGYKAGSVDVSGVAAGAQIGVASKGAMVISSNVVDDSILSVFTSTNIGYDAVKNADGKLATVKKSAVTHCICGAKTAAGEHCDICDSDVLTWQPWTQTNVAPYLEGNWYLTYALNLTNQTKNWANYTAFGNGPTGLIGRDADGNNIEKDITVNVDLNGYTITGKNNWRVYRFEELADGSSYKLTMNITDTSASKAGSIVAAIAKDSTVQGLGVWLRDPNHTLNIWGGTISAKGGPSNQYGPLLNNQGGSMNLYGGTVYGVTTANYGGAIHNTGTLTIHEGVTIGGGSAAKGGAVYSTGNVTMTGGTITGATGGGIYMDKTGAVLTVSGAARITGNNGANVYLVDGAKIIVGEGGLTASTPEVDGAVIGVTAANPSKDSANPTVVAENVTAENAPCFVSDSEDWKTRLEGTNLTLRSADEVIHCLCNDSTSTGNACADAGHQQILWTKWTETSTLPTTSGYYYLAEDVTLAASCEIAEDVVLAIDLRGKTIGTTTAAKHVFDMANYTADGSVSSNAASTLILTDSVGGGKIDSSKASMAHGRALFLEVGTVNIYGGTITGHTANSTGTINSRGGATCVVNMYGGTIEGSTGNPGGALHWRGGTFNMYGGTITGGKAVTSTYKYGGNINITAGTFNMYGGLITGGQAVEDGGNVDIRGGAFNMMGGEISGGTANIGGDVYLNSGSLTVSGDAKIGDLYIANGRTITVGQAGLTTGETGAKINVTMKTPGAFTSNAVPAEALSCFTTAQEGYQIGDSEGKAALIAK